MKEYLVNYNGVYALVKTNSPKDGYIEVPEGAESACFYSGSNSIEFYKKDSYFDKYDLQWCHCYSNMITGDVVWQRHTQPESLPFIDDEVQSINDQYAEIEKVRQAAKDNVNHPSHYADSAIECIDAMEAMMTPEQFIGYLRGNLFKYQWRYEKKNGIEDLKKAQWYLEKLTVKIAEKNALF